MKTYRQKIGPFKERPYFELNDIEMSDAGHGQPDRGAGEGEKR